VEPVATHLEVQHYACTRLLVEDGRFTGAMLEPPCFGPGKLVWARRLAGRHGARLEDAYFYSDGYSDRTLLQAVGHPVAVNPDRRLAHLARIQGWPVERFY
jgi:phosphoserine phosphatase